MHQLSAYNKAARHANWLVLMDLDAHGECAPDFVRNILPDPVKEMRLRLAVPGIEEWFLADRERMARFCPHPSL
ncbi:MAG TPA: hypothetical protein VG815_01620 [Chloroflexota bacterium]|jgi:hypothetical protein|nr:hypothetical protein [Chloroflexota bacterium]